MAHFQLERLRALPVHRDDELWEVGLIRFPVAVSSDDAQRTLIHPILSVCVSNKGGAAMSDPLLPQDMPRSALLDTLARFALDPHTPGAPALGYLPQLVRTATDDTDTATEFINAMRELGITVEVTDALPTLQEFESFLVAQSANFMDSLEPAPSPAPSILRKKGMTVDRLRAFAEAASVFFEAQPWTRFPDEVLWRVDPRPKTRALSHFTIMGGAGEQFGIGFLASPTDMMRMMYQDDPETFLTSTRQTMWSIMFDDISTLPEREAELWERESLPVARQDAYPLAMGFTPAGRLRRPSPAQLDYMEAVLRAAAQLAPEHAHEDSVAKTVRTHDGERTLHLRAALNPASAAGA